MYIVPTCGPRLRDFAGVLFFVRPMERPIESDRLGLRLTRLRCCGRGFSSTRCAWASSRATWS